MCFFLISYGFFTYLKSYHHIKKNIARATENGYFIGKTIYINIQNPGYLNNCGIFEATVA